MHNNCDIDHDMRNLIALETTKCTDELTEFASERIRPFPGLSDLNQIFVRYTKYRRK